MEVGRGKRGRIKGMVAMVSWSLGWAYPVLHRVDSGVDN